MRRAVDRARKHRSHPERKRPHPGPAGPERRLDGPEREVDPGPVRVAALPRLDARRAAGMIGALQASAGNLAVQALLAEPATV